MESESLLFLAFSQRGRAYSFSFILVSFSFVLVSFSFFLESEKGVPKAIMTVFNDLLAFGNCMSSLLLLRFEK